MLRTLAAATALCAVALAPSLAEANVTYTLVNQQYSFPDPNIPQSTRTAPFNLSFTVSDAAVSRGSFQVNIAGNGPNSPLPPTLTGDASDFVSVRVGMDLILPSRTVGAFSLSASFAPTGSISSAQLQLSGDLTDARFSGTSALFSGSYGGLSGCGTSANGTTFCNVSGQLAASVPEPMSLALLGVGLTGLAVARKRRA